MRPPSNYNRYKWWVKQAPFTPKQRVFVERMSQGCMEWEKYLSIHRSKEVDELIDCRVIQKRKHPYAAGSSLQMNHYVNDWGKFAPPNKRVKK
jgi:hypothetical protein